MGWFDDVVPPDAASYVATPPGVPRITVRPKGVAPPPALPQLDDMSADVGLAPNEAEPWGTSEGGRKEVASSRRAIGLFDDIVAPAAAAAAGAETPASYGSAPRVALERLSPPAPEPSLVSRLVSPLTDIPHEIYQAGAETLGAANTYLNPWSEEYRKGAEADRDKWISTGPGSFLGTGKGLLAAIGVPFSPITGAMRSLIGHPLSVIMPTATPHEQERMRKAGVSESMIPGQTREENYQKAKGDVDVAMMAVTPRGFAPRGAIPRSGPRPPARPPDTAAAQSNRMMSEARESGPFDSGERQPTARPSGLAADSSRGESSNGSSGGSAAGGRSTVGPSSAQTSQPNITAPYSRPPHATTRKQRASAQGKACVNCGRVAPRMNANHIDPLVVQYYRTGAIDTASMRSVEAVNAHCPTCSARQGGLLSNYSKSMKQRLGL
jgi:hypothetical protein